MKTLLLHLTLLKFAHSFLGNLRTPFYVGLIFADLFDRKNDWTRLVSSIYRHGLD